MYNGHILRFSSLFINIFPWHMLYYSFISTKLYQGIYWCNSYQFMSVVWFLENSYYSCFQNKLDTPPQNKKIQLHRDNLMGPQERNRAFPGMGQMTSYLVTHVLHASVISNKVFNLQVQLECNVWNINHLYFDSLQNHKWFVFQSCDQGGGKKWQLVDPCHPREEWQQVETLSPQRRLTSFQFQKLCFMSADNIKENNSRKLCFSSPRCHLLSGNSVCFYIQGCWIWNTLSTTDFITHFLLVLISFAKLSVFFFSNFNVSVHGHSPSKTALNENSI